MDHCAPVRPHEIRRYGRHAPAAQDDCYDGPAPCATQEEMDDLGITIAQAQDDVAAAQADYDEACSDNPQACSGADDMRGPSGPSDDSRPICYQEAAYATVAVVTGAASFAQAYLTYTGAVVSGLALTTAGWVVMIGSVAGIGFGMGFYVGAWVGCLRSSPPAHDAWGLDPFEAVPVLRSR